MKREEALKHFHKEMELVCQQARKDFDQLFRSKLKVNIALLRNEFDQLAETIKDDVNIGVIQISFLRTGVLNGTYDWYMEAQTDTLDQSDRHIEFTMEELFAPFEWLEEKLVDTAAKYVGTLTPFDAKRKKMEVWNSCIYYLYYLGTAAFIGLDDEPSYQSMKKAKTFRILLGEYKDKSYLVFVNDEKRKKGEEFFQLLYSNVGENGFTKKEFAYENFNNLLLKDECIAYKDIRYARFRNATFDNQRLVACNGIGADFSGVTIKNSFIHYDVLIDSCFERAVITDTNMWACHFEVSEYNKEHVNPGIMPVSFAHAVLTRVDFTASDLRGCKFNEAKLEDIKFEEANLSGAVFTKEQLETLNLTDEQKNSVKVV